MLMSESVGPKGNQTDGWRRAIGNSWSRCRISLDLRLASQATPLLLSVFAAAETAAVIREFGLAA